MTLKFKTDENPIIRNREKDRADAYQALYKKHTAGLLDRGFALTDRIDNAELWTRERQVLSVYDIHLPMYDAVLIESNRDNGSVNVTKRLPRYSRLLEPSDAEKENADKYDAAFKGVQDEHKRADQERRKNIAIAEIEAMKASGFQVVHRERNYEMMIKTNEDRSKAFIIAWFPDREAWQKGEIPKLVHRQYAKSQCTSSEKEIIAFCRAAVNLDDDPDAVDLPFDIASAALAILDSGADMPPDHPGAALAQFPEFNHARLRPPRVRKALDDSHTFIITGIFSEIDKTLDADSVKKIRFIASDTGVDRESDRVLSYEPLNEKGVPMLINHDINRPIGRVFKAEQTREGLLCDAEVNFFSPDGLYAWNNMKAGHLCEFSIKFKTKHVKRNKFGGFDFEKAVLLEISLVTVPANANTALLELSD